MLTLLVDSNIKYFYCDVASPQSICEAAHAVRDQFGHPSILVNNAGIGAPGTILDKSDQFTEKLFTINIISHFTLIREYMPDMVAKNKGHIVGLGSMASFVAPPGMVDYAAAKAAVLALHEGWCALRSVLFKIPNILSRSQSRDQARVLRPWCPEHYRASILGPHRYYQRLRRST